MTMFNLNTQEECDMNKSDLISAMASSSNLTKKDSEAALNGIIESISEALGNNDKVVLVGFGTWEVRERAAKKGRNPRTKEEITIPATRVAAFKAGSTFKEDVNNSGDENE